MEQSKKSRRNSPEQSRAEMVKAYCALPEDIRRQVDALFIEITTELKKLNHRLDQRHKKPLI